MLTILYLIFIVLVFLSMFYLLIVHPVWTIVDCAISKERTPKNKALWIVGQIFTWTIGSLLYGIFATKSRPLKIVSIICAVAWISTISITTINVIRNPEFKEKLKLRLALSGTSPSLVGKAIFKASDYIDESKADENVNQSVYSFYNFSVEFPPELRNTMTKRDTKYERDLISKVTENEKLSFSILQVKNSTQIPTQDEWHKSYPLVDSITLSNVIKSIGKYKKVLPGFSTLRKGEAKFAGIPGLEIVTFFSIGSTTVFTRYFLLNEKVNPNHIWIEVMSMENVESLSSKDIKFIEDHWTWK